MKLNYPRESSPIEGEPTVDNGSDQCYGRLSRRVKPNVTLLEVSLNDEQLR